MRFEPDVARLFPQGIRAALKYLFLGRLQVDPIWRGQSVC